MTLPARDAPDVPRPAGSLAPAAVHDEEVRQAQLDAMKWRATALLVAATVVFIVARLLESRFGWLDLVRATAEAAMVGGLADWFAVTALFRHPLGIPIPHTAIVPAKKDRVGRTLGAFVQRNFLAREVIEARLRALDVGARLMEWLADPANTRTISRTAASALGSAADMLRDDDVQAIIDRSIATRVRTMRVAPLLGRVLGVITEGDRHQEILDELLRLGSRAVDDNRDMIRSRIEQETPWWVPTAIDEKIFRRVLGAIQRLLFELRADPSHPLRERFDTALKDFVQRLNESPETAARVEAWKEEFLDNDAAKRFSATMWEEAKDALARYAANPESSAPSAIEHALTTFGQKALEDPELLARVNGFIIDVAVFLVARYQDEVADLIAHTVAAWDPELTSRRVELAIGRDLQYIRINGTIVGGLAGLLIYLVSKVM